MAVAAVAVEADVCVLALAEEASALEGCEARRAAELRTSSPLHRALLAHHPVATPCGRVRAALPQPAELSMLQGRLDTRNPADGVFDPTLLGSAEARDELQVELAASTSAGASTQLRLWAFLAHLVPASDLFPRSPSSSSSSSAGDADDEARRRAADDDVIENTLEGAWRGGAWTGTVMWDAAMHATAFLLRDQDWAAAVAASDCVLELGAGLGLPALACVAALGARRAVATDRAPQVLDLLRENAARNDLAGRLSVASLDWSAEAARDLPRRLGVRRVDVVIACDCILAKLFGASEALAEFLGALAEADGGCRVLLASELRPESGVGAFLARAAGSFAVRRVEAVGLVHLYELRPRPH